MTDVLQRHFPPTWEWARLSRALLPVVRPVRVRRGDLYREIGIRSHGRGVFHKEPRTGAELGEKRVFWIEPDDFLFNIVFAWEGAVALASEQEAGCVGSHRFPTFRINGDVAIGEFLLYLFRTAYGRYLLELNSPGAAGRNKTLNQKRLLKELVPLPAVATQRVIADFLDRKTAAIDALIEKKERLIALLQEKRQALITQAVTKGLDPSVPMKDSGIEWLGEIPAHWGLIQVRRIVRELCDGPFGSSLKSDHYEDDGVRVIRLQNIRRGWFDGRDEAFISTEHFSGLRRHEALPGDLLIAGLGDTNHPVGRACILPSHVERAMVKADCYRARLEQDAILHAYAAEFFSSDVGAMGFAYSSRGTTRTRINLSVVRDMWIPVPPMQEQAQISTHLASVRERYSALEARAFSSVQTLREYRQALITAAVTGQIDVTKEAA